MNSPTNPAAVEIDGYDHLESIGRGGFSYVYRASQVGFDRKVALKVLTFGLSDENERRSFERECRAMGLVSQHPNIVTVFNSAFTKTKLPCIVMELYSGGTMAERLERTGSLPIETVLAAGVKLAGALHTAHERGLLHRDIKPQNIFISEYGEPALGDFGISTIEDERTISGAGGLTVHYAPPEMLEGAQSDERSDIYSLAATLYTLIEGRRPFAAPDGRKQAVGELARRIILEAPAPMARSGVSGSLQGVLMEALAKNPAERPATAAEFGERLRQVEVELGLPSTPVPIAVEPPAPSPSRSPQHPAGGVAAPPPPPGQAPPPGAPAPPDDQFAPEILAAPRADDLTDDHQTITAAPPEPAQAPVEEEQGPSTKRLVISAVTAAVAMLIVVGFVWFFGRGEGQSSSDNSTGPPTQPTDDDPTINVLPAPEDIKFVETRDSRRLLVTWAAVAGAESYVLTRTDPAAPENPSRGTEKTELVLRVEDPRGVCVVVQAIARGGLISDESDTACKTQSAPPGTGG